QHALEHQVVGRMVAAENRILERQLGQEPFHLDEQFLLIQRLEIGELFAVAVQSPGKADHQGGEVIGLGKVHQAHKAIVQSGSYTGSQAPLAAAQMLFGNPTIENLDDCADTP